MGRKNNNINHWFSEKEDGAVIYLHICCATQREHHKEADLHYYCINWHNSNTLFQNPPGLVFLLPQTQPWTFICSWRPWSFSLQVWHGLLFSVCRPTLDPAYPQVFVVYLGSLLFSLALHFSHLLGHCRSWTRWPLHTQALWPYL